MNKFIKTLIIINGLIIPLLIIVVLFQVINPFQSSRSDSNDNSGVIVGEVHENAKNESLALQGLEFGQFEGIHNSPNFYLPVSVMTYEEARQYGIAKLSAGNMRYGLSHVMNIIFVDKDFNVINTLLDRKASISELNIRPAAYENEDTNPDYLHLAFLIGFEDSNSDGKLNSNDAHDLYITDLQGKKMVKASEGVDIVDFNFSDNYSKVNIRYKERTAEAEEHKREKFASYHIVTRQWIPLEQLNEKIDQLEELLIK